MNSRFVVCVGLPPCLIMFNKDLKYLLSFSRGNSLSDKISTVIF